MKTHLDIDIETRKRINIKNLILRLGSILEDENLIRDSEFFIKEKK